MDGFARAWWFCAGVLAAVLAVLVTTTVTAVLDDPHDLEEGQLVILSGRDDSVGAQRQQLVSLWNALHRDDEIQATIVTVPADTDAQRSEMLARAQAGGAGVDIYNLDVSWTAEFADAQHLLPLDESEVSTAGFLAGPLATCRYAGRLWALPFNTDVGLLYYRTDLLPDQVGQTGAPADWDAVEQRVDIVRARSGGKVDGYVGQFRNYEGLTVNALEVIRGAGATVVDDAGHALPGPGDPETMRAALARLKRIAPPEIPESDEDTSLKAFADGRALFLRNWPVAYQRLRAGQEKKPVGFAVAPLPGGAGVLGGQNLAISAHTDKPKAARDLIQFLTGDRSQQVLLQLGGLPATRELVYADPAVQAAFADPVPDFVDQLHRALLAARPRPAVPHYAQFSASFRTAVDDFLRGDAVPSDDQLRDRLDAALRGIRSP